MRPPNECDGGRVVVATTEKHIVLAHAKEYITLRRRLSPPEIIFASILSFHGRHDRVPCTTTHLSTVVGPDNIIEMV